MISIGASLNPDKENNIINLMLESNAETWKLPSFTCRLIMSQQSYHKHTELQEGAGEEMVKVGWIHEENVRGTVDKESGHAWGGGQKRKTEMGGLFEERFGGKGSRERGMGL